jgi:hypothetical protein
VGVPSAWGCRCSIGISVVRAREGLPAAGGGRTGIRITRGLVWRIHAWRGYCGRRAFVERGASLPIKLTIQYLNKLGSNKLNKQVREGKTGGKWLYLL